MTNSIKIVTFFLFFYFNLYAESNHNSNLLIPKNPIEKIVDGVDFSLFIKEFEVTGDVKWCQGKDGIKVPGFMTHLIEPVAFVEAVSKKWYFRTLNFSIDVGKSNKALKVLQLGSTRNSGVQEFYHYIKFPLFGMIIPETDGLLCFERGTIDLGYISEADPTSAIPGVRERMFVDMVQLYSPQGLASAVFDCIATTTAQFLDKPDKYTSKIRNSFYYNCGCVGITGVSQREGHTKDPFTSSVAAVNSMLNLMQYSNLLKKSSKYSIGGNDSSCAEQYYPRILKTQWKLQPFYPYTLDPIEVGLSGLQWDNFSSSGVVNDDAVYLLWKRRDYAMGSYQCK